MAARHPSTEAAVADAAAQSDVRAAAGAPKDDASRHGPGSGDPLLAGLRRTGLLRLLVLHLLGAGPSYGNQLMERVGSLTGGLVAVNPNTMYPLLRNLEAKGLIAGEWEHPERRSRRFYAITDAGLTECATLRTEVEPRLQRIARSIGAIRSELKS